MTGSLRRFENLDVHWTTSEDVSEVTDGTVQSVITSPPYWDLKDYGHEDQIGRADQSYEEYHDRLTDVWQECYDVLRSDGTMWIVVDTVMENGDLTLLPQHIVERCENVGFHLQDVVVWYKPTAIAGMTERNVVNKKEYVLYFSREKDHLFCGGDDGENDREDPAIDGSGELGNLWRHPVKRGTVGQNVLHDAPYHVSLAKRIVRLSTTGGDTVLDPFLGSGTTAVAALELDRRCIGYELNADFEDVIAERLSDLHQRSLQEFSGQK